MANPEILDVLLASPPSQPRVPETAKGVPAHPRFVKLHGYEALCKPTFFNVVVQVRRAVPGLEEQAILAAYEHSQVLCNFRVQIEVAVCRIGL